MATVAQQGLRGRPAHPAGPTCLTYTPDGTKLITAGTNDVIRVYATGSDGEPTNIDDCQENNTAIAASNKSFLVGSEEGTVAVYSLESFSFDKLLTRCTLPIRDLAISPNEDWVAVASDEVEVKLVDLRDMMNVIYLREHPRPAKHVSFHPSGSYMALSCTDGIVYIYSISNDTAKLVRKIDGVIQNLETYAESTSRAIWHPDGRAFAAATVTRDIQVISRNDGERQRTFAGGHMSHVTALAWSPNGALLLSAGLDGKILLWETATQKILSRYDYPNVINIAWHPFENLVSFTTSDGELFIYANLVPSINASLLEKPLQPAPFIHDPDQGASNSNRRAQPNGLIDTSARERRRGTPDTIDEILGPVLDEDEGDFVSDDDGAGYLDAVNGHGKRTNGHLDPLDLLSYKRRATGETWRPSLHESFQPGSTPWRGNRRYLCLNLIGFVWTVDQESHHTVTVEFYDRELHRDFHFTDNYSYDKACLNENGALFSCPPLAGNPAIIFYRPHETWTARTDWRTQLPPGEDITSISLSDSYIVVTTSTNYVRVFTLFGTPFSVYRAKSSPSVTCASWGDYVLTMGNGAIGSDGSTKLVYSIENVKRDQRHQNDDLVALPDQAKVQNVFFSDTGDPCIYDSTGVLLILQHWRRAGQAKWVPLLDTKTLDRLATGRKEETYWPVAVAQEKFHCIILKGGDQYPYFPKPLLSEFDFKIPCSSSFPSSSSSDNPTPHLEESLLLTSLHLSLLQDLLHADPDPDPHQQHQTALLHREIELDKILLQLMHVECRGGEERGMKALELVRLMRDPNGKMLEAAGKVAERYGLGVLRGKIGEVGEEREREREKGREKGRVREGDGDGELD